MSNLTDFFPASSGGGAVSNNPMDLPAGATWTGYLSIKGINSNTNAYAASSASFWDYSYPLQGGVFTSYTSSDIGSYVTITDISSAPNGGRFFNVIGPAVNATSASTITTFKITVDGDEYIMSDEYQGTFPGGGNGARSWLGNILYSSVTTSATFSTLYKDRNAQNTRVQLNSQLIGGQFISPDRGGWVASLVPAWPYDGPSIRFNESLKVEVKVVGSLYQTSGVNTNAGTVVAVYN